MNGYDIFVDAHYVGEDTQPIGIAVLCSCGAILLEAEDHVQPQLNLDDIVEAVWNHRDAHIDGIMCEII